MNASPIKAVVNDTGKQCDRCGARPRYPHTLGCTVAYPVFLGGLRCGWCNLSLEDCKCVIGVRKS